MIRNNLDEVFARNKEFISNDNKKGALILFKVAGLKNNPSRPLEEWGLPENYRDYMDAAIENLAHKFEQTRELDDDALPCLKPFYGIAEHSAFVGGEVSYMGSTSYHHHPIKEWEDFDKLTLDENNVNFRQLLDSMAYLEEKKDKFGFVTSLRGVAAPMEMANALRGNDFFMDMYEEPEMVHKLLDFCVEAGKFTLKHQLDIIGTYKGGVITGSGMWLPGNSIGHVSEDASSMCSNDTYQEFGLPYTQRLIEDYDSCCFHTHSLGKHVLPSFCSINKARIIQITDDPNQMPPIEVYKLYQKELQEKIVQVELTPEQLDDNMEFFEDKKTILVVSVSSIEQGQHVLEKIKHLR